jgi:hypothetical protein
MTMLKHIAEFGAAVAVIPLFIWLKYRQIKDNTIFGNDEGPQTLFNRKKNDS